MDFAKGRKASILRADEKSRRDEMKTAPRPKLAATILLVRGKPGKEEILVGLRSKKHDFMPNVYVFPGGRVDGSDSRVQSDDKLNPRTHDILTAAMSAPRARACVLAAIRETFEETGFILGEPGKTAPYGGKHESWRDFAKAGLSPDLSEIHVIGRAVTPPYRPKRFDTWFFMTRLSDEQASRPFRDSDELLDTQWVPLQAATELKMHAITEMMVDVLIEHLGRKTPLPQVPYSRFVRGAFKLDGFPTARK